MTQENVVVDTKVNDVPMAYKALGVTQGYAPPSPSELRFFITGPSGEGKTTFLSSIPDTLILDFEKGASGVIKPKANRVYITSYDHYMQVTDKLIADGKANTRFFKRIGIDTVDEWMGVVGERLLMEKEIEDVSDLAMGKGWALLRSRCWGRLRRLQEAGYSWVCNGHLTEKQITDPITKQESTVLRPVLFDSFAKLILRNSDIFARVYCLTSEVPKMASVKLPGGEVRKIQKGTEVTSVYYFDCTSLGSREGKVRGAPSMKKRIELPAVDGWKVFEQEYNEAVKKSKGE